MWTLTISYSKNYSTNNASNVNYYSIMFKSKGFNVREWVEMPAVLHILENSGKFVNIFKSKSFYLQSRNKVPIQNFIVRITWDNIVYYNYHSSAVMKKVQFSSELISI